MFGNNIKTFRVMKGMSQSDFGKSIGVAQSTVTAWENNESNPNIIHAKKMIDIGASIDFILYGIGSPLKKESNE